jgi:hypothetical protein
MTQALLELLLAPLLVGGSTLACRRWDVRIGGLLSAFPAVVGPILLVAAQQRGPEFTERAANGTLVGLLTLSGFCLAYARVARRAGWGVSLAVGWACAGLLGLAVGMWGQSFGLPDALAVSTVSLMLAYRAMPSPGPGGTAARQPRSRAEDIPVRMAVTAALVLALAAAERLTNPLIGGMLAALPVLASALAAFTHRRDGGRATIALLRGVLTRMSGFVAFCAVVAALVVPAGVALAFGVATVTAVGLQALTWTNLGSRLSSLAYRPAISATARRR